MSGQRPRVHGRDHRPGGADPIPGLSDALHWGDNTDTSSLGLTLTANANVEITAQTDDEDATILISQRGSSGDFTVEAEGEMHVNSDDEVAVGAPVFTVQVAASHVFTMGLTAGVTRFVLPVTTGVFRILDHSGNALFEVRDDGTVHIKTGGTVTADL